ncbi:tyrosine-type recombinase/integrase [Sinorhizobium meliloti]|uniref:tyrosine-type recombinase/integrase n=1 Tax=Rhizobium meliloti TaxID=382 RepID=UPI000FDA73B0|nr:tyrosine-type recombinase/integrase [Sinorhizobium meliloti]RVK14715.1 hypothetical protein CN164_07955 [Sinorhizobium meliloti]
MQMAVSGCFSQVHDVSDPLHFRHLRPIPVSGWFHLAQSVSKIWPHRGPRRNDLAQNGERSEMPKALLDDKFARSVERPEKGFVEYTDERIGGYEVRVFATRIVGNYRYRPKGSSAKKRLPLGEHPHMTMAQLRSAAETARGKVRDGGDPLAELDAIKEERRRKEAVDAVAVVTVNDAIDAFTPALKARKKSWQQDLDYYARDFQPTFGTRAIASVTKAELSVMLIKKAATAAVAANRLRSALLIFFDWCVEATLIESSPMIGIKKPTKQEKKKSDDKEDIRALSDAELVYLWKAIGAHPRLSHSLRAALKLILLTGQRPNEIAGLELRELNHIQIGANGEAYADIPARRMKGGRRHVWPISEPVAEIIRKELERQKQSAKANGTPVSEYVFASRYQDKHRLARHSLSHALRRLIEALPDNGDHADVVKGLKADRPTPHALRRTCLTGMGRLRVPREIRKAVAAHKEDDVLGDHYDAHDYFDEKKEALDRWAAHVMALVSDKEETGNALPMKMGAA